MDRDWKGGQSIYRSIYHVVRSVNDILVRRQIEKDRKAGYQERIRIAFDEVSIYQTRVSNRNK